MKRTAGLRVTVALLAAALLPAPRVEAGLTEGARLGAVYDAILDARFDAAETALAAACPPAPVEACKALATVSLWWQILLNPNSRLLDGKFNDAAAAAIAASTAWTKRDPQSAEAWFYFAGSYAPLVQWRVLRGERLAAAREANRIREALERTLQLDPTIADAYFGIGLYHYYADVVPGTVKFLRWLMALPGGDRVKGMREMTEARDRGTLLTDEADYQIHLLNLWYEHKPAEALQLLRGLDERHPANPIFLERIAEVEAVYFHDHPASAASWRALVQRAQSGHVNAARIAETNGRLGLARELDAMFETDRALDELKAVITANPIAPYGARAQAELQLASAYDRLGLRDLAVHGYSDALAQAPDDDVAQIREKARAGLRQTPDARHAEAYRTSLEGWRTLERGRAQESAALLAGAAELAPEDPVIAYRYARALEASGERDRARAVLETVIAARAVPAIVLASAWVDYAAMLERAGDRARALAMYRDAASVVGGDPRARDRAARAIKRLAPSGSARIFF